jgi:hypothetical protein
MWKLVPFWLAFALVAAELTAQPPAAQQEQGKQPAKDYSDSSIVTRMMAFNKKKDGKLTKEEVTDARLHRLFDQADTNKDGVVTREELMALAAKVDAEFGQGGGPGGKGKGPKGPKGFGGKGEKGFGGKGGPDGPKGKGGPGGPGGFGKGGPGGFGGAPQLGQILPTFIQDQLNFTSAQKKQLSDLQKQVDDQLDKILTDQQKQQFKELRDRGPGGFGPPKGGPGGLGAAPPFTGQN